MSKNNFDDFLKDSFSGYSPEVPPHIWENIAAQQKKKRPAGFWLNERKALLALVALLFVAGGAYFLVSQKDTAQNIARENNGSRQATANTEPAAVLEKNSELAALESNGKIEKAVAKDENTIGKESRPESVKANGNNANTTVAASPDKKDNASINKVSSSKTYSKPLPLNKKKKAIVNTGAVEPDASAGDDAAIADDDGAASNNDVALMPGSRDIIVLMKENLFGKLAIVPVKNNAIKISEECPGSPSGNQSYFEAYISPDYAIKKYTDTANSSLVAVRKGSLRYHSAYSAGLRYTKVFSNGMSIRAGFNFSQVNEKFSYAQGNVVQLVYVINNQGDTTDSYYVRGTRYRNSYNHYRTIDVPVAIGYEMGNTNFHANINAGPVINIYSWQNGETIGVDGSPVKFGSGSNANSDYQYKTNIGIGFTAAASLYYKFSERCHFLAEPYVRYNFAPMNRETLSIQEKFTTIGLRLGIRVDLK